VLLGLVVLALGVIFLLDAAGVLDASTAISRWWPSVFVAAGLLALAERPPARSRATILLGAGLVLLAFTTHLVDESAWAYLWPVGLILAGLSIVLHRQGRAAAAGVSPDDVVRATAIFGGPKLESSSRRFRGAWLTAIFGGITLDLRSAELDPGGATINVTTAFGGVDLLVPHGWRMAVRGTPIAGGVDDETEPPAPGTDAPVLAVDALTVFGGVSIKHEP
jgi:predicted membrane protein